MSAQNQAKNYNLFSTIKNTIIGLGVGVGILSGVAGFHQSIQPSDNISRYLRSPIGICLNMPDYAAREFVRQYRKEIIDYAKRYNMPPEMSVAIFLSENYDRKKVEDWKDWLAAGKTAKVWDTLFARFGKVISKRLGPTDPSLGPGQVKVSTAIKLDEKFGEARKNRDELESLLQNPSVNIEYVTKNLSELTYRKNRLGSGSQRDILNNPHLIAIVGSEHVIGGKERPLNNSQPSPEGLSYAILLTETDFKDLLGNDSIITKGQQAEIKEYVDGYLSANGMPKLKIEALKKIRKDSKDFYRELPC